MLSSFQSPLNSEHIIDQFTRIVNIISPLFPPSEARRLARNCGRRVKESCRPGIGARNEGAGFPRRPRAPPAGFSKLSHLAFKILYGRCDKMQTRALRRARDPLPPPRLAILLEKQILDPHSPRKARPGLRRIFRKGFENVNRFKKLIDTKKAMAIYTYPARYTRLSRAIFIKHFLGSIL